ncbi:hypothetical protein GCM10027275_12420 [Rhabdobacter roseus]|uniref:Outer membrane protein beta-barrel domain-containing protein n=1 Tax=Rhabdobacter roseus TaxID=1655419 RepID=A0A840TT22_9BACT|nr:hypothetical protein [Rhabdobacter roseus]MBB5283158.1 hypothetical protein [Rhabdobacter roseus]
MRHTILLSLLLAVGHSAAAQEPALQTVKAGVSYILFGSGDMTGINYYNEYNRQLNRFMAFGPSVHLGYGSSDIGYLRFTKASFALDPNLYFSPMRFDRSKVRIGVGPSFRFLSDSHPNGYGIYFQGAIPNLPSSMEYVIGPLQYERPQNYWTVGYTVVLEAELKVATRWMLGARASFQSYTSGETAATLGLNVGYLF